MSAPGEIPHDLRELEERLCDLSHDLQALRIIQEFARSLKKRRQEVFNAPGALLLPPVHYKEARDRGLVSEEDDVFSLLQGDIVATDAAYFLGERLTGMRLAVVNATCDLVPGRRRYVALLPVRPIHRPSSPEEEGRTKTLLGELLSFKSTWRMYLPPLPDDPADIVANAIEFDGIAQARLEDLLLAERIVSLSLIGWRIFASHLRGILARTGESEVRLREGWR